MIPPAFDYAAPTSVDEAIRLLQENGDDAKLLAGGHSLIPLMKLRLAAPSFLVDLGNISELRYIRDQGDHAAIGAMTTHRRLETSQLLRERLPLVAQAASMVGDAQVRNRGTFGGSVAHSDPASDLPAVLKALRGEIVAVGPNGPRLISAEDFFQDIWTNALEANEIVTEIRVPYGRGRPAQAYEKFSIRASDWALVGAAVDVERDNGRIGRASIVLTNVGSVPVRASAAEEALRGQQASADVVRSAAERASDGLDPTPELKASPEYKRHLARVLTRRALQAALQLG
jgi:carbon-monoxide dehydrogenase medium subunit